MWLRFCLLSLAWIASKPAFATETDDISTYYVDVADSTAVFDAFVQRSFDQVVAKTLDCDMASFAEKLAKKVVSGSMFSGTIEDFGYKDPSVVRLKTKVNASIYGGTYYEWTLPALTYGLAPIVSVAGVKVGTDKLGHFIENGWYLYKKNTRGANMDEVIAAATKEEEEHYGWGTSGVKSFGDMAADMDGVLFWNNVAGRGTEPYLRCEGGRLVKLRDFHFKEYLTPAWNEAINCSQYKGDSIALPSIDAVQLALEALGHPENACDGVYAEMRLAAAGKFKRAMIENVARLEKRDPGVRYTCPIDVGACREVRKTYEGRFGRALTAKLLSPECYAEGDPKSVTERQR